MGGLGLIIASRLAQAAAVVLTVATLTFVVVNVAPGDLALKVAGARYGADLTDRETARLVRLEEGLDSPAPARYLNWLGRTARLDFGCSLVSGRPVSGELAHHFKYTLRLSLAAMALSLIMAAPPGIWAGLRPGGFVDTVSGLVSSALSAVPPFAGGIALILVFSIGLGWLPATGYYTPAHLVLPALTLALGLAAVSSRIIAASVSEVRKSGYYRFALTKGLTERSVMLRHGAKNAAPPILTYLGLQLAHLLDGVVVVETLFSRPGIGRLLLDSVLSRDIPMVQAAGLFIGLTYVTVNMSVDLVCAGLCPGKPIAEA